MSDARAEIMAAIRKAAPETMAPDAIAKEAAELVAHPVEIRPVIPQLQRAEWFKSKASSERVTATIDEVADLTDVPHAVADYLKQVSLPPRIALQPRRSLMDLDWGKIETHADIAPDEPVGVSIADAAIAETGSVVFRSGPDAPVLLTFLPLHHIVIVPRKYLMIYPEDIYAYFGTTQDAQPRNLNIVTGTSGTADIEAKNIRGAHGPRFMHLILCEE